MSDLVINVRQLGNYPAQDAALPSDLVLIQRGGLGGPYLTLSAETLVSTALATQGALGLGYAPPGDASGTLLAKATAYPFGYGTAWNAYANGGWHTWQSGAAGRLIFDGQAAFRVQIAPSQPADRAISAWADLLAISAAGAARLPSGTLTVARDPASALEVATMGWVGASTVGSFNGRRGQVQLTGEDVYRALDLDPCDPFITVSETDAAICRAIQQLLQTYPAVWSWNGRVGDVWLTTEDINWALEQGGIPPLVPTPGPDAPDNEAANIGWVRDYVAATLAGPPAYATQDWVTQQLAAALAGTVQSFNGRQGVVTLQLADVTGVGGAPSVDPSFTGYVSVPTANPGISNAQAASTAFVMAAVSEATAGVASFNTRTGAVVLTSGDISDAGGALLNSPAFAGTPTAPTPNAGDSSQRIATTAFVMNEIAEMTAGVSSFNGRAGAVTLQLADVTGAGGAPLNNAALTGIPTAPTAANGTSTQQLATTAFVQNAIGGIDSGVVSFNGRTGAITLTANDVTAAGGLANPSAILTGTPTAPTAAPGTSTTQLATTAFIANAVSNLPYLPVGGGTLTGPLTLPAGSSASPSLVWGGAAGASLYNNGGQLQLGNGGIIGPSISATSALGSDGTLTVTGNSDLNGTLHVGGQIIAQAGAAATPAIVFGGSNSGILGSSSGLGFAVAGSQILNIAGNGATVNGTLNVNSTLAAAAAAVSGNLSVGQDNGAGLIYAYNNGIVYPTLSTATAWSFWFNGTFVVARANGATDYPLANASDERLKETIQPSSFDGLDAVVNTPLWQFGWKCNGVQIPIGFVAQRMTNALASAVLGKPEDKHADGTDMQLGLDPLILLAAAYDAIKRLHQRVAQLEARFA